MVKRVLWLTLFVFLTTSVPFALADDTPLPKPDVLGEETIYTSKRLSSYNSFIVRDFPVDGANISNIDKEEQPKFEAMKGKIVNLLSDELVKQLKARKLFKKVQRNGKPDAHTLILEGKFTEVDAGNRALKVWVGFGAGKSKLTVKGRILDAATGKELVVFENDRHAPMSLANFEEIFLDDTRNLAEDFANFLEKLY